MNTKSVGQVNLLRKDSKSRTDTDGKEMEISDGRVDVEEAGKKKKGNRPKSFTDITVCNS
jgi:hypothetical protein